ncbi:MAG: hypothetical protein RLZZ510_924, partial [Bacteroidota bacterium]
RVDVLNQIVSFDTIIKTFNVNVNANPLCFELNPNSSKIPIARSGKMLKDLEN